jgi:UDP-GlcNAc:undecaprenyl-phosphate GlcNAc-1-phosphate transferase
MTVVVASVLLSLVGLLDDFRPLKPYQKLIAQVLAGTAVIYSGSSLPWTPWPLVNVAITLFWLVGITNAVNLLDNMDGLAAGVAAIAAVFLAVCFVSNGDTQEATFVLVLAAALIGFLCYNSNPASIFMGDCGSMFIGLFLASSTLLTDSGGRSRSFLPVLAVPVLVLLVPIFDITVVTLLRKLAGRPASQGGRDHTSHRLVALGMSERAAVWMLYSLAAVSGLLALLVRGVQLDIALAAIATFTVSLVLVGTYLGGVKVYQETQIPAHDRKLVAFLFELSHRRRIFEVLLDVVLIMLACYLAHLLLFGPVSENGPWQESVRVVPVMIGVKLIAFLAMGVYRGLWRYVSVDNLIVYAKGVLLGSLLSVLSWWLLFGLAGFSLAACVLDGLILLVLLAGSRVAFRLFRSLLPAPAVGRGRRVLIYGAGDGGEWLLRVIHNDPSLEYLPVGFVDDDPLKTGKVIHGLRVLGGNGSLQAICKQHRVQEVLISSARFSAERTREILADCTAANVALRRVRIDFEALHAAESPAACEPQVLAEASAP